ncbi:MAG: PAS domain-containing protein, partial [Deltaproteobacteria bacterium]|nr:PAS domain-containing protein [Deltaproteobacteria bacterium]
MPELTTITETRLRELKAALTRLARDEAQRTRVVLLMDRLRDRPGHEAIVAELLRLLTESLGGRNAALYYRIDDDLCRLDLRGGRRVVGEIDDGLVRYVFETRESVSRELAFSRAGMTTPEPARGTTWVMPLLVGAELVAVLRLDDPSVAGRDQWAGVQPFLPFASVALRNEISAERRRRRILDEARRTGGDPDEDVAELKKAGVELEQARDELERRLAERSAELREMLEGTSSPVFALDEGFRYVAFNRSHASAMRALYGAEIEIGRNLLDYMTVARDREEARKHLERALGGEALLESAPSGEELRSKKYFEVSHHPVLAADGAVIGVAVFASDITERQRAEEDRLAHLRFFESLDQINRALQGTSDLEQMMSDVLDAVLDVFGCDRAWLVYPCDPASATYRVPMERTRPEYPGAL